MIRSASTDRPLKRFCVAAATACMLAFGSTAAQAQAQAAAVPVLSVPDFTEVVAKSEGSVVNIRTTENVAVRSSPMGPGSDPYEMFRWFFGPEFSPPGGGRQRNAPQAQGDGPQREVPRGVGSGFIISDDGYILTNTHVIDGANGIFVTLTDGKEHKAKIIGSDARTDVALIKIEASGLKALPVGDSKALRKGQWVLAIGSPFGLESTVTAGIVSAINRDTGDYLPFIQTDVAVNPGNSGGPLLNLAGEVVGINSQIVSQSGGFMGISLAIPIEEAMRVSDQLKSTGKVTRGRIGVQIGPVSEEVAKAIGLPKAEGAMVSNVEAGGPAAESGVMAGDVITRFGSTKILQWSDLPRVVGGVKPGTTESLYIWRKGKEVTLRVRVGEFEADAPAAAKESKVEGTPADALGLKIAPVPANAKGREPASGGVLVTAATGPAAASGIAEGDIILTLNDTDVKDPAQFAKLVSELDKSRAAALLVQRGGQSQWVVVTPAK